MAHIVLLLLITGEYSYLANVRIQKMLQDCMSEAPGSTGNQQNPVVEVCHFTYLSVNIHFLIFKSFEFLKI